MDLFITSMQLFTAQTNWWTGVVRLSFWRHPFPAEDQLVSKWFNSKCIQICNEEKQSIPLRKIYNLYKCKSTLVKYIFVIFCENVFC